MTAPIPIGKTINPAMVKLPLKDLKVTDGKVSRDDLLTFITQLASVTPNYQEGTFTGQLTGLTSATPVTVRYEIIGNVAVVCIAGGNGTSNSTQLTITGVPSVLFQTNSTGGFTPNVSCVVQDNGTFSTGFMTVSLNSSVWSFSPNFGTTTFTASGVKGIPGGQTIIYYLK